MSNERNFSPFTTYIYRFNAVMLQQLLPAYCGAAYLCSTAIPNSISWGRIEPRNNFGCWLTPFFEALPQTNERLIESTQLDYIASGLGAVRCYFGWVRALRVQHLRPPLMSHLIEPSLGLHWPRNRIWIGKNRLLRDMPTLHEHFRGSAGVRSVRAGHNSKENRAQHPQQ